MITSYKPCVGLDLVAATGVEPATYRLSGDCSTLLSYAAVMARMTGLEPAASGVTGRRSRPTELHPHEMVPTERIELPTFGLQNRCTTAVLYGRYEVARPRV